PTLVAAEGRSLTKDSEVITKIQGVSLMRNGLIVLHAIEGTKQKPTRYIGTATKLTPVVFPAEEGAKGDAAMKQFDEPVFQTQGMLPYAVAVGSEDIAQAIWIGWNGKFRC